MKALPKLALTLAAALVLGLAVTSVASASPAPQKILAATCTAQGGTYTSVNGSCVIPAGAASNEQGVASICETVFGNVFFPVPDGWRCINLG